MSSSHTWRRETSSVMTCGVIKMMNMDISCSHAYNWTVLRQRKAPPRHQLVAHPSETVRLPWQVHERGTVYRQLSAQPPHRLSTSFTFKKELKSFLFGLSFCLWQRILFMNTFIDYVQGSSSSLYRILRYRNCLNYITLHYITLHSSYATVRRQQLCTIIQSWFNFRGIVVKRRLCDKEQLYILGSHGFVSADPRIYHRDINYRCRHQL